MKLNLNKIKKVSIKLPIILAENPFRVSIFFIVLALIIGGLMFYKYNLLAKEAKPQIIESSFQFKEKILQEVINEWDKRNIRYDGADSKQYPNLFRISTPSAEQIVP